MTQIINEEQAVLSTLTPAMRRAILSARPLQEDPEWDTPADYCTGHESLRGDLMGATQYCEGTQVCHQARERYTADRVADPDRKVVTISPEVTIGTVVALIGRGLVEHAANTRTRDHELTDKGLCVLHALNALQERGQAGVEDPGPARLARKLEDSAIVHHVRAHTVSTVLMLLVRERIVTGSQAERLRAIAEELDKMAVQR